MIIQIIKCQLEVCVVIRGYRENDCAFFTYQYHFTPIQHTHIENFCFQIIVDDQTISIQTWIIAFNKINIRLRLRDQSIVISLMIEDNIIVTNSKIGNDELIGSFSDINKVRNGCWRRGLELEKEVILHT